MAPPLIAAFSLIAMLAIASLEGLPIRDPDARYVGSPLALIGLIAAVFIVLDVGPRAWLRRRMSGSESSCCLAVRSVARALVQPARRDGPGRAAELLRHLPLLSQPEELHPLRQRRRPRHRPPQPRPLDVLRQRPGDDHALDLRHRDLGRGALDGLPRLPHLRPRIARRRLDLVVEPARRPLVRDRALALLAVRCGELLHVPRPGARSTRSLASTPTCPRPG